MSYLRKAFVISLFCPSSLHCFAEPMLAGQTYISTKSKDVALLKKKITN